MFKLENMLVSIELSDFISPQIPEDVVQIDLLYKQENSNNVYILGSVSKSSAKWNSDGFNVSSSYKGNFNVSTENIYAASTIGVPSGITSSGNNCLSKFLFLNWSLILFKV